MDTDPVRGCADRCQACKKENCDNVCFGSGRLGQATFEVDGFRPDATELAGPAGELPAYIPMLQHRSLPLRGWAPPWAAIPLREILRPRGTARSLSLRFASSESLRASFHLPASTHLVLVGTGKDMIIEHYWRDASVRALANGIADLGFHAAVAPNFSIWDDDPRLHHLYNRKRSQRVTSDWARCGVPVIPFVVGSLVQDWRFWEEVLAMNPALAFVAKEFQTGLADPKRAAVCLGHAIGVQRQLGRALHLVAIGGRQHIRLFESAFDHRWTVVDSTPFMKAMHRQRAYEFEGRVHWRSSADADLSQLFEHNLHIWTNDIARRRLPDPRAAGLQDRVDGYPGRLAS